MRDSTVKDSRRRPFHWLRGELSRSAAAATPGKERAAGGRCRQRLRVCDGQRQVSRSRERRHGERLRGGGGWREREREQGREGVDGGLLGRPSAEEGDMIPLLCMRTGGVPQRGAGGGCGWAAGQNEEVENWKRRRRGPTSMKLAGGRARAFEHFYIGFLRDAGTRRMTLCSEVDAMPMMHATAPTHRHLHCPSHTHTHIYTHTHSLSPIPHSNPRRLVLSCRAAGIETSVRL